MTKWKFGLIGCGSVSEFHRKSIGELPNAELVMLSDRTEAKANQIAAAENCRWTTDYRELLQASDVDIVCLTTSSGTHASIGIEVLRAGKHLIVEKPIAMTAADADRMIAAAEEAGVTISVISQRRYEPQHRLLHRLIQEGRLGKLLLLEATTPYYRGQDYYDSADWRGTVSQDGGALMNQGIHQVDLLLWLGGEVVSVFGHTATQTHRMEAEDIGVAVTKFSNGALGTVMASTSIQPGFAPSLVVYGEKGTVKLEGSTITHWTVPGVDQPVFESPATTGGGISDPKEIPIYYHKQQIASVLKALEEGNPVEIDGTEGKRAVQFIEAIYRSSASGEAVQLVE
ncbi:oxidoreductase [Paenibacillus sp. J31TS4]|uniref:Gfo/Idh/MocA family protein n=1 Tax=Paenibacillus sp. J31TS4 TaxID=2807195 RepID=UPI001B23B1DD|nr:Gfo/Idh/MocA family oxidoreductase [Paenibacillus sp. J31TS4]GIP39810.1 oxidoreductase [Paenibacillus sp. J31TS4]